MIKGLGVDLVEVGRIQWLWRRWGERFVRRVLTPAERSGCPAGDGPAAARYLAGRVAAKEALFKALGTGLAEGISWQDVEIRPDGRGSPCARLAGVARARAEAVGADAVHVSISHARGQAVAVAILESAAVTPSRRRERAIGRKPTGS